MMWCCFFENLSNRSNISFDKEQFDVGLYFLKNGGDFADGVIFYQSQKYSNATVLSFDKKANKIAHALQLPRENF